MTSISTRARKLGLHPYPAPMAIASVPYNDRAACAHCGFCIGFSCEMQAKSGTLFTMIPEAEATGHCEVRSQSYVTRIETNAVFEHELNEFKSAQVTRVVHDWYDHDPKRGFYGGGGLDGRIGPMPLSWALFAPPPDKQWGAEFKALLEGLPRSMIVASHGTSLPLESNAVDLDPHLKDAWGMPALRVTYHDHPEDLAFARFMQDRSVEIMQAAGAQQVWKGPVAEATGGPHLLGTARMGNDPATSVVDKYHRTHDIPNLFPCDGSSMVTSGGGQPTMTIQALAFRAGEHIARFAKAGEV